MISFIKAGVVALAVCSQGAFGENPSTNTGVQQIALDAFKDSCRNAIKESTAFEEWKSDTRYERKDCNTIWTLAGRTECENNNKHFSDTQDTVETLQVTCIEDMNRYRSLNDYPQLLEGIPESIKVKAKITTT